VFEPSRADGCVARHISPRAPFGVTRDRSLVPPSERVCEGGGVSEPSPVQKKPMPTPTRVAVILLALLGVLLVANAVLTWLAQEAIIDRIVDTGADRDAAARSVLLFLLSYAVIGVSSLLASIFLPRRRRWARQVGILTTSLLVVMTIFSTVTGGAISPIGLLVLVSAIAGLTSLLSKQTKAWLLGSTVPTD
jgi:hypothetical protein